MVTEDECMPHGASAQVKKQIGSATLFISYPSMSLLENSPPNDAPCTIHFS